MRYFDLIGLTLIILPTVAWVTWGLWDHFMEAYRTGERSGSGGWNPIVWPFKFILLVGFAISRCRSSPRSSSAPPRWRAGRSRRGGVPPDLTDHGV